MPGLSLAVSLPRANPFDAWLSHSGDTLETLPGQLESTATSLTDFTGSADELQQQLDDLAASVASISDDLGDTDALVDQYRASVADARALALSANDDLDTGAVLMRILLVVGGVTLLLGQIVPLWLGRSLLDDADAHDGSTGVTGSHARAVAALDVLPDHVLVDARTIPGIDLPQEPIVKGDRSSHAIAKAIRPVALEVAERHGMLPRRESLSAVNFPSSSTGQTTGIPSASQRSMSSSPNPGAQ